MLRACVIDFRGNWQIIYLGQSLLITTVTNLALTWCLMKHSMGDLLNHPSVRQSWVRVVCWDLRLSKRLEKIQLIKEKLHTAQDR